MKIFHNICMVSDFFYPNLGGIEEHIYHLCQSLLERGHKVVVVTRSYEDRKGIRWMSNGLKVYYIPAQIFYNGTILPTLISLLPLLREIFVREEITIVHSHGAFSSLGHEGLFAAKLLGLRVVFTEHSLFGFADASAIITNRFLELSLADVQHCICVSRTGKGNTVLRANINADYVYVIPNAVDSERFRPKEPDECEIGPPSDRVVILISCRLVYRKGIHLIAALIPSICDKYLNVDFLIAGEGPMRELLEEIKDIYGSRVQLFGKLEHAQVRNFLIKGHIFLNASFADTFCMAIVEAACCGLQVVSTNCGGIPEVLPPDLIIMAEATVLGLLSALETAIANRLENKIQDPFKSHDRIASLYNWRDVASRTEIVYDEAASSPALKVTQRMSCYFRVGFIVGPMFVLVFALGLIIIEFCNFFLPIELIDIPKTYHPRESKLSECANQNGNGKSDSAICYL